MEFEVREVYSKSDLKALNVAATRTKPLKTMDKIGRGFRRFWGGLLLFSGVYLVVSFPRLLPGLPEESKRMLIYGVVMALIFGVLVSFPGKIGALLSGLSWKNYKDKGVELAWWFSENEFKLHTPVSDTCCQYSVIDRVVESPTHVFLFLDARTAYMIRKDSFLAGDADMFGSWVAQKCGKELIKIK